MPESTKSYTFRKAEKLCSQTQIDKLFSAGKSLSSRHFRLVYIERDSWTNPAVKILIAVPKKNLKHAVDRNRMKRLIREAYRNNKNRLLEMYHNSGKNCDVALIFTGKQCISQQETLIAIIELLDRFIHTHEKNTE